MALIVCGYRNTIRNKKFLGIKPCGSCMKPEEMFLARSYFQATLFYIIPIFGFPTGRYLRCGSCGSGRKLTRTEWKELKEAGRGMPKRKDYLHAYDELRQTADGIEADDLDVAVLYNRLLGRLDFADENGYIRSLVDTYVEYRKQTAEEQKKAQEALMEAAEEKAAPAASGSSETVPTGEPVAVRDTAAAAQTASAETSAQQNPADYLSNMTIKIPRGKKRLLWLLAAIPMLPVAAIFAAVAVELLAEDIKYSYDEIGTYVAFLVFMIPVALDVLFFVLSFKKYKKIR